MDCDRFESDYMNSLNLWAKENRAPVTANFELTPFCNFSCVMCYVRLDKKRAAAQGTILTADEWIEIAKQAKDMGTLNVALTGGEPFVHPEFWKIYGELNKMGFLISILTNGYLIDDAAIENFRNLGMPYRVKISIYGASNETYLRTCGVTDGFSKVSESIDRLKAEGVPISLSTTIVRENADDLKKMYEFAAEKSLSLQHTINVLKSSRNSINTIETSRFSAADFSDELTLERLEASRFPESDSPFAWCAAKDVSFRVSWHGRLHLCSFVDKPYVQYSGDLATDYRLMCELTDKIKNPPECSECKWKMFCQRCPGILCAESSDPERIDKEFCDMARRLYELYSAKKEKSYEEKVHCSPK